MANEFLVFRLPEPWATGERNRIAMTWAALLVVIAQFICFGFAVAITGIVRCIFPFFGSTVSVIAPMPLPMSVSLTLAWINDQRSCLGAKRCFPLDLSTACQRLASKPRHRVEIVSRSSGIPEALTTMQTMRGPGA